MKNKLCMRGRKGFTLIEILLVIGILLIFLGMAVPNMRGTYDGYLLKNNVNDLTYLMRYAQSLAVTKGLHVRLSFDVDFQKYWLAQQDEDDNNEDSQKTYHRINGKLGKTYAVAKSVIIESEMPTINFFPDGTIDKINLFVCPRMAQENQENSCMTVSTKQQRAAIHVINGRIL